MSHSLSVTHTSEVTADQIDQLGHMNVRFYGANAMAATGVMRKVLGVAPAAPVVDIHTRHHHEQLLGSRLEVVSGAVAVDGRLGLYHELRNADTEQLAATFVHVVDVPSPALPVQTIPAHGRPRSLDMTVDPITCAPTLAALRELALEIRPPRALDEEITPATAAGLIWGGLPTEAEQHDWIEKGPQGERMAWATMESRLRIARLPNPGTTIQSFGATTAVARKTTRSTRWVLDLERGDVLVAFDVVNLAFDVDARRAMHVPDDYLDRDDISYHPEFAAG